MRLSYKMIIGVLAVVFVTFGVFGISDNVLATGKDGDSCYRMEWYTNSGTASTSSNNPNHDIDQSSNKKHTSNRVCYDSDNMKIYAEEITGSEPLALGVKGDMLCLLKVQNNGSYEPSKCTNEWKTKSVRTGLTVFDESALSKMVDAAGGNSAQVGVGGGSADARGSDFKEAAQLTQSDEELANLVNVDSVGDVIGEQSAQEREEKEKENEEEGEKTCASSGAGGALGWILCPILENVSEAANDIYNEYVEPSLEMNADLFSGGDDGTRAAWEMFRNIANVAFIILLLVVIFSQLTGYGIDNYGIKKILPKLIVGVLLMNMSYLICVLCVDLSNIFGAGLKDMFDNLAPAIAGTNEDGTGPLIDGKVSYAGSTGRSLVSLGLLGALGAGGTAAVIFNPAILLSLLVAAIGIGISIFFLFLLLSARQAAVVVLTVISPLAFAAFMLPNTKKYYDKWLKFMQVMLLVYPIAGLLVGGGNFVSSLLVSAAEPDVSFMTALTAMLVGVVPILFIPSVIKGSFAAFGSAGKALSGFGKQASSRAQNAARGSGVYKGLQERGGERRARMVAGVKKNKDGTYSQRNLGRFGMMIRGGRRNVARNSSQFLRNEEARAREAGLLGGGLAAGLAGIESKVDADKVSNAEAMLSYGKVGINGEAVSSTNPAANVNDMNSMKAYHAAALERYRRAADGSVEKANAMAEVKAAQNIMSKTDKGRAAVQKNFESSITNGNFDGLSEASSHLLSNFGDKYKSVNRGAHAMISDLATANLSDSTVQTDIQNRVNGTIPPGSNDLAYRMRGADKYTAESLVNADDSAIDDFVSAIQSGALPNAEIEKMQATAYEALQKQKAGTLNIKPEVASKLEQMLGPSYVPKQSPNSQARMISHGAYEDSSGAVHHLREMDNGKFIDDNGNEVDITHFRKR